MKTKVRLLCIAVFAMVHLTSISENTTAKEVTLCFVSCAATADPTNFFAASASISQINLSWTPNVTADPVMVAFNINPTFGTPVTGTSYTAGDTIAGGGTVLYNGTASGYIHTGLNPNATYYYKAWSVASGDSYSGGVTANATTTCSMYDTVSVTITASANPVCAGTGVTFTSIPVNGGTTPAYQWNVNGINVNGATNDSYFFVPSNGITVNCILTSNALCITGNPANSNTITMTMNPLLAVGSISSDQTICTNAIPAQLNGIAPSNGTNPTYQWQSSLNNLTFNNISGATILDYQPGALSTTTYYRQMQDAAGTCGGPLPTNTVTVSVNPWRPVSVTIAASANPVCPGTVVAFTATPVNGGSAPAYQWKVNGTDVTGITDNTYSFVPVNDDTVSCVLTSDETCTSGNPAASNILTMTVNPLLVVGSISSDQTICANSVPALLNGTGPSNGTNPTYQWQSSLNNLTFSNISGATMLNYQPGLLTSTTFYRQLQNAEGTCGGPLQTNTVTMTVNPQLPVSVSIAASVNPVCEGTSVTYMATPVNGGTAPAYQWKKNGTSVTGATNAIYTYVPDDDNTISCVLTSSETCTIGNPATSNTVTMMVNPLLPVSVSIAVSENPVCAGTSVTFTATPVNGGITPAYQWKMNGTNVTGATNGTYTYVPANGNTIACMLTSSETCTSGNPATSNTMTMTVNPLLPVSVTITASANPVCAGTIVTFTATPVNGGTALAYQWKKNGTTVTGATDATYTYVPADGNTIACVVTSSETCTTGNPAISNTVTMLVNPLLPVGVTIAASANPVCAGTLVTYTATPANGGTSNGYQWKVNGINVTGATNATYMFVPANGNTITSVLTSSETCTTGNPATSNTVTMTVNPLLPVSVTIAASANPVCAGTSVTYTATPANGGTSPGYQWKVNGTNVTGATNASYMFVPANGNTITSVLTSSETCTTGNPATSNTVTMTVNPLLPVSVTIAASANPVCAGTSVTFTATPANGGNTPAYLWKVNGTPVPGATNASYAFIPVNGNTVACMLNSIETCTSGNPATSNTITMAVNPLLPAGVTIAASANPVCAGTTATFTATPTNGGAIPAYQWRVNGSPVAGATNSAYSFIPISGNTVYCVLTSNSNCVTGNPATSNTITMTVNPLLPVSITISASANPVCAGTPVTFTATPANGGTTPGYQWSVDGTPVPGATNSSYAFIPVNGNMIICVLASSETCTSGNPATSNAIAMTVNPLLPVSVLISTSANPVCAGTSVTFTATPAYGGTTPAYQWNVNGTPVAGATNSSHTFIPANGNAVTCVLTSSENCTSGNPATSNTVTMTVNPVLPVSVTITASGNPVCAGTSVTFTATPANGGTTPVFQWKVNGTTVAGATSSSYAFFPVNGNMVTSVMTSSEACTSGNPATSNTVSMSVNPLLPVSVTIAASANPVCAGTSVTFTATPANGGPTPGYQWEVNGTPVTGATNSAYLFIPANGNAVTCVLTSSENCTSGNPATSNTISMTVNPLLPVSLSVAVSANPVCVGTPVTYSATPVYGGINPGYQWKVNATSIPGATNAIYTYNPSNNDAVTCLLTSSETCTSGNPATSNAIVMTVNPLLPVSVSIAASANPVCAGTQVTYTATPVNGGTNPIYQWKLNGITVPLPPSSSYTFIPENGNTIACILTSNETCTSGNPASSNSITMTVNPILPVSVTISASANPVCQGTPVTYTAVPANGGSIPSYQWLVNTVIVSGATNATYVYNPANNDVITCVLTSNANCTTGNPAISNTVAMTVKPILPVSVSISASAGTVCAGTTVVFTAYPVNGGITPAYQWRVNGTNVPGATNASYGFIPVNGNAVTCVMTSSETCTSGNPATSNTVTLTVNPLLPVSISITASTNPVCAGTLVTYTGTPVNGGTSPIYQWKVNGINVSMPSSPSLSFTPANGDAVTCILTSNANCTTGNPATSNTLIMTVNPILPVSVSVAASANPICAGTTVTFTATPVNGGATPSYQWKVNAAIVTGATNATYVYNPANTDAITCTLTSVAACTTGNPATSNTVNMTVNPLLPVSVTIAASTNPICAGTSVTFTATPINGGATPGFQWKVNGANVTGATNSSYGYVPVNGNQVTCILTSSETCKTGNPATSNTVTMMVNPLLPVSVSIAPSANPVCAGTLVTFTATPVNGGTSPIYQWKINGINVSQPNSSSFSFIPVNGSVVTCVMTSDALCTTGNPATSSPVTMTVNPVLPVSVSITASANPVCAANPVTFTATPVNGGTNPLYQWKVNGTSVSGATSSYYTFVPGNGNTVSCAMTSNASCTTGNPAASNTVTMTVSPVLTVSVSISASANPICAGTQVSYTAVPVNGGTNPAYQWKVNGSSITGATSATYTYSPANSDVVTCVLTSSATCTTGNTVTSNALTMTVNPLLPVSVSITALANPVCAGSSVIYTAIPVYGGTVPSFQWKVNGTSVTGATSSYYEFIPANGNTVTCVLTSSEICTTGNPATSNTVTMTVNPQLPVSISIAASANPVCADTSVTYTATPVNGGTTPIYQWKVNGTNVSQPSSPVFSFIPANGNTVTCVMTSSANCTTGNPATSNTVIMAVNPVLTAGVLIAPSANPVCAGTSVTFSATPLNGGTSPSYQWKVNASNVTGATSSTFVYVPLNNDVVICMMTSNATCTSGTAVSSNALTMAINPLQPVSVSITASANQVCSGTPVTFSATPVNGGASPSYQWKVNGTNVPGATNSSYSMIPVNGNTVSCMMTSGATCATGNPATSNTIAMTVNPQLPVSVSIIASANPVCTGTLVTYTATPVNGGTNPIYQWKVDGIDVSQASGPSFSFIPGNGNAITCVMTSSATCTTGNPATSNTVTMTVNQVLTPGVSITASANPVCNGTSVTFTATAINGGTAPGYQWTVNGSNVAGATNAAFSYIPVSNDAVICIITTNLPCATGNTATSNTVNMRINQVLPVSVSISASTGTVCAGTPVTFTATPVNGGTVPGFQWKVNATIVTGATNATYTFSPANNDQVTCLLNSSEMCTTGNPATSSAVTMTVNPLLPVSISIAASANPVCAGTLVTYTATQANGGTSPFYQWKVNGVSVPLPSNPTYSFIPANGNVVTCVMTSSAACASENPATSNAVNMSVNPVLPVSVSVVASANPVTPGTPVTFTATPANGGSAPAYLWKVNGINVTGATAAAYTYTPADGDMIACVLTSNAPCVVNNPATSNTVTMSVGNIPSTVVLQNMEITGSQCFNAIQTITVAGSGTNFTVKNGGSATMIAGLRINYLPGTKVFYGGSLRGYITTNGQYCGSQVPSIPTVIEGVENNTIGSFSSFYRVYPNPTDGIFTLELKGSKENEKFRVEIYSLTGEMVFSANLSGGGKHDLSLSGKPVGIYLLKVISETNTGTARIIKQ